MVQKEVTCQKSMATLQLERKPELFTLLSIIQNSLANVGSSMKFLLSLTQIKHGPHLGALDSRQVVAFLKMALCTLHDLSIILPSFVLCRGSWYTE